MILTQPVEEVIPFLGLCMREVRDIATHHVPAFEPNNNTLGPFIREKIRRALHKTRTARINGTKQAFASYFRRDLHKTCLILEQNFWLFLFCPRLK